MVCQCIRFTQSNRHYIWSDFGPCDSSWAYTKRVQMTLLYTQSRGDECSNGRDRQILPKLFNLKSSPLEIHLWNFYFQKKGREWIVILQICSGKQKVACVFTHMFKGTLRRVPLNSGTYQHTNACKQLVSRKTTCVLREKESYSLSESHIQDPVPVTQKWKDKVFALKEFKVLGRQA